MHDNRTHPLLAQVPLTVSPFVSLPTATTLPYTYKNIPSTLPPSSTGTTASVGDDKAKYVVSSSGHSAHPDDIIASCQALQSYIQKVQDDADRELKAWEEAITARELAEKRRVAPGWLDSDARILEPAKAGNPNQNDNSSAAGGSNLMDVGVSSADASGLQHTPVTLPNGEGDELDRAFGGLGLKTS
ncbi:hypothetical protein PVAG01_04645 [Phlyctema vagabunda]|uniref:Uncharacterized protein n=1 Tax=Phlyctema vagabunda TaxID=108571 RepID=A0ABR4PHS5_9HELO